MNNFRFNSKKLVSFFLFITMAITGFNFGALTVGAVSKPKKISNVKITKTCPTAVSLSWSKSNGAKKYLVYRKYGSSSYKMVANTSHRTYVSSSLKANKKYTFKITPYKKSNGKVYCGASKVKSINLKTAKTHTPRLTSSNVNSRTKGIVKCLARSLWLKAYVNYDFNAIVVNGVEYWRVTDVNSISAHNKRCLKYLSSSCFNRFINDNLLIERNNRLYVKGFPTDGNTKYDLNSISLKKKSNGYYYVNCDAYSGLPIDGETKYVDQLKIKFSNGYFKCFSVKNISKKYVGTVTKKRNLTW